MPQSNNKKILGIILVIILLVGLGYLIYTKSKKPVQVISSYDQCAQAGYPILNTYPSQCKTPDGKIFVSTSEGIQMKTFTDSVAGVTFEYPVKLSTKYMHPVDWPPKVQVLNEAFACSDAGLETGRAGKTEKRTVGSHTYCVTSINEGAAGSTYTQYAYAMQKAEKVVILTFSIQAVQCGNYNDPQKTECQNERNSFNIDNVIDPIFTTLQLKAGVVQKDSGMSGTVLLGPTCPVQRNPPDPACADKPYKADLVVVTASGSQIVKQFTSDDSGKFSIKINPGEYEIKSASTSNLHPRCSSTGTIKVTSNTYTIVTVSCDTGIR